MTGAKRWFEAECRHCGGRFIETADLNASGWPRVTEL